MICYENDNATVISDKIYGTKLNFLKNTKLITKYLERAVKF